MRIRKTPRWSHRHKTPPTQQSYSFAGNYLAALEEPVKLRAGLVSGVGHLVLSFARARVVRLFAARSGWQRDAADSAGREGCLNQLAIAIAKGWTGRPSPQAPCNCERATATH